MLPAAPVHYSSRLRWSSPENALARRVEERRAEAEASHERKARRPLIDLTISNPTRAGIEYPEEAIRAALGTPGAHSYDPSPRGLYIAREAVARYYADRGLVVSPEHLVLTASTSEAYAFLFKLLCDPGDAVLVPTPSYPLFDFLAALECVRPVPYALGRPGEPGDFSLTREAIETALEACAGRARAILLVSPNNPTGTFLREEEQAFLVEIARARGLALICDEVFGDYAFAPDESRTRSLVRENESLVFTLSGLSKVLGLPQLKLGWIHVSGPSEARDLALERLDLVADTFLSVGTPVQVAAPRLFELGAHPGIGLRARIAERTRRNLAALQQSMRGTAVSCLPVEGGWYAVLRLPAVQTDEAWALELLADHDVLVQPGYFYDFPSEAHVVLSLLPSEPDFAEGTARLLGCVARYA